ncbi:hypothetical protein N9L26_01295 [Candidatus Pacebacteria bacterium]|nr:hypothetical protein [Candidatus Paceibacterota bacterium]
MIMLSALANIMNIFIEVTPDEALNTIDGSYKFAVLGACLILASRAMLDPDPVDH